MIRLGRLTLRNFAGLRRFEYDLSTLDGLTFVVGPNGAGKTTRPWR